MLSKHRSTDLQTTNRSATCGSRRLCNRVIVKSQGNQKQLVDVDASASEEHTPQPDSACPFLSNLKPVPPPNISQWDTFVTSNRDGAFHPRLMDRIFNGQTVASGWALGLFPAVLLGTLDAMKEAVAYEPTGEMWQAWPQSVRELLGPTSITVTSPDRYRIIRQVLAAGLNNEQVDSYLPAVQNICQQHLTSWEDACRRGDAVAVVPQIKRLTMQVLTTQVMELDLNPTEFEAMNKDFADLIAALFVPFAVNVWPYKYHFAVEARKRIIQRLTDKIAAVRAEIAADSASGSTKRYRSSIRCFLAYKDDQGNAMTDEEVFDGMVQLLFAGHDTTASWVYKAMAQLATRPQILDRIRAEQKEIVAKHGTSITAAALKDMTYTTAVLNEVMRLQPVVAAVPRKTQKDVAIAGHAIPAGTSLQLNLGYVMRHDPRWPADGSPDSNPLHPDNFNPDRFMSPEGHKQGAQVPFGLGGRTCAGIYLANAEAKVFLAELARNYTYVADLKNGVPNMKDGLPVFLTRIHNK